MNGCGATEKWFGAKAKLYGAKAISSWKIKLEWPKNKLGLAKIQSETKSNITESEVKFEIVRSIDKNYSNFDCENSN